MKLLRHVQEEVARGLLKIRMEINYKIRPKIRTDLIFGRFNKNNLKKTKTR